MSQASICENQTWGRQGWHQIEGRGAGKVTVKAGLYCTPPGGGRDGTKSKAGGQGRSQ